MSTYIILIPIEDNINARDICETVENSVYTVENVNARNVLSLLLAEFPELINAETEPLSDFMDRVNNEEFNPDNYFMSYVQAKI